ncbi:hypothetical protein J3F83DRAFT_502787 [Trichoderma novae-zelandiae]
MHVDNRLPYLQACTFQGLYSKLSTRTKLQARSSSEGVVEGLLYLAFWVLLVSKISRRLFFFFASLLLLFLLPFLLSSFSFSLFLTGFPLLEDAKTTRPTSSVQMTIRRDNKGLVELCGNMKRG